MIIKRYVILFLCVAIVSVHAMARLSPDEREAIEALMQLHSGHDERSKNVDEKVVKLLRDSVKGESGLFKCAICGKIFKVRSVCEKHEATHLKLKPYRFRFCGKGFTTKVNLNSHMFLHEN